MTLMIHEVINEDMFSLNLEDYNLTFDDGLYSQYYYSHRFEKIDTDKTYFISSGIVCNNNKQSDLFFPCHQAHQQAFKGDFSQYMTIDQIKELSEQYRTNIGCHSHSHTRLTSFSTLKEKVDYIKRDTEMMLEWFNKNLNFVPTSFCFPYNDDMDGLYKGLLKGYGFTEFHGRERTPIEKLLHDAHQSVFHDA